MAFAQNVGKGYGKYWRGVIFRRSYKELDDIAARVLSNQEEVKRLSEQLTSQKLLAFYKENANLKVKELSYDKFVKEVYGS